MTESLRRHHVSLDCQTFYNSKDLRAASQQTAGHDAYASVLVMRESTAVTTMCTHTHTLVAVSPGPSHLDVLRGKKTATLSLTHRNITQTWRFGSSLFFTVASFLLTSGAKTSNLK